MDEIISYLGNLIVKNAFALTFLAVAIVGYFMDKFRSSGNSESAKDYNYNKEPMSADENIGEVSMRLGEDVREVWGKGYSDNQINGVLTGKYTLEDLYKMKPEGKR